MGNSFSEDNSNSQQQQDILTSHTLEEYRLDIDNLRKENILLQKRFDKLYSEYKQLKSEELKKSKDKSSVVIAKKSKIDKVKINEFVENMLQNPDINIYGFPDALEKQIYRNVFGMLLNMLDNTLETVEVRLLGHKIIFDVQPINEEQTINTTDTNVGNPTSNTPSNTTN